VLAAMVSPAGPAVAQELVAILVLGNARGCFGARCTPLEADATIVNGVAITYTSNVADFKGVTANALLAISAEGTSTTGNFGLVSIGVSEKPVEIDEPFTLELTFGNPFASPVTFKGRLVGTVNALGTGAVMLDLRKRFGSGGLQETVHGVEFLDPFTKIARRFRVTAAGMVFPSGGQGQITGLFDFGNLPEVP
jgi:hypothetical protein